MAYGLPGFSVRGILQARILEWVAFPFCRGSSQPRDRTWVCYIEGKFFTAWATCKYTETLLWLLLLLLSQSLQSCPTLCDPIDGSPPDSPVPGILQAKHWSVLPFPSPMHESEKWKWSCSIVVRPSATPWTAAFQAPASMGFSRQEYWSGVPLPSPTALV